jgi:beta-galactosidase
VTSYDYNAPLTEAGDLTPLWYALRDLIARRTGKKPPEIEVHNAEKAAYGQLHLNKRADLFENLTRISSPIVSAFPKTMEEVGQDFGYILYSTTLRGPFEPLRLQFGEVHDRAIVFVNGERVGIHERSRREDEIKIGLPNKGDTLRLDILVENMGRVNYGIHLFDRKGILGGIRLGQQFHYGWEIYPLSMEELSRLAYTAEAEKTDFSPCFLAGNLKIDGAPKDTYLRLDGFTKGFCTVNGFNIGRYFNSAGPQKTLYIPAPLLREGDNEIVVFESDGYERPIVTFTDRTQRNDRDTGDL